MLLSKQEAENKKIWKREGGGKKWNNFKVKSKGANVKIMVLLFFVFEVCLHVSSNTLKYGFQPILGIAFLCKKLGQ